MTKALKKSDLLAAIAEAVQAEREAIASSADKMGQASKMAHNMLRDTEFAAKTATTMLVKKFAQFAAAIRARGDT